jgi:hypothetical protein
VTACVASGSDAPPRFLRIGAILAVDSYGRVVRVLKLNTLVLGTRDRIAGAVYGTIVVLAALTAGASAYEDDLWRLGAIVSASVLVLWVAHVYAHGLGESLTLERRLTGAELRAVAGRELSIALAAVLPLAAIALGALGALEPGSAIWLAFGLGVATLGVQGVRYARLEQLGSAGTVISIGVNVGLGLTIVAMKLILG